ncbi:MAG: hypothetical protein M3347_18080 [Armatimonadota bacterium]|nr:hypothetical protein [Armatimonadota bacterium]
MRSFRKTSWKVAFLFCAGLASCSLAEAQDTPAAPDPAPAAPGPADPPATAPGAAAPGSATPDSRRFVSPALNPVTPPAAAPGAASPTTATSTPAGAVASSWQWSLAHDDVISLVAFSSDGKVLATGGTKGSVRLWDVLSGKELRTLNGHTGRITSLLFSPDSTALATASEDKTVKVWNLVALGIVSADTPTAVAANPVAPAAGAPTPAAPATPTLGPRMTNIEIPLLPHEYRIDGIVRQVNVDEKRVRVEMTSYTPWGKPPKHLLVHQNANLQLNKDTRLQVGEDEKKTLTIADLKDGDPVVVVAARSMETKGWVASKVMVWNPK